MNSFTKLFGAIVAGPAPQLNRDKIDGFTISTVDSADMGYETAILDSFGAHPVERYGSKEAAREGHLKWVEFIRAGNREITMLGYDDLADPIQMILS